MRTLKRYLEVAVQLSPAELAALAARRAYRSTRQRLHANSAGVSPERLLQSLGAATPEALAAAAFAPRAVPLWCDVARREEVRGALALLPGALERSLERAEAALERRIHHFGHEVVMQPGDADFWRRDPLSGHLYPQVRATALRLQVPGSDPKWPWALGRLDGLVALAQGYWVASDAQQRQDYVEALCQQLLEFIDACPVGEGVQWACPMDVALRAANIAQALWMVSDAPCVRAPAFLTRALQSLVHHAAYVEAHLEDAWSVPNNHLVSNHTGLMVVASLFPRLPGSRRLGALAARGLRETMRRQVHPDGVSFEGSLPYHRLSVELFLLGLLAARAAGKSLGRAYALRLRRMLHVVQAYCTSSGRCPQVGDNDSGRAWPLQERESLDHGYLVPLGAALYRSARLKEPGAQLPDEAVWLLGREGLRRFNGLGAQGAPPRTFLSPLGGVHLLRGPDALVCVSAGAVGQRGTGGHSHNDQLSFELHLRGRALVVDPGTGTYTRDARLRNQLRGTAAHNTLEVDGQEQAPFDPAKLFLLTDGAHGRLLDASEGETVLRLRARHDGYRRLAHPLGLERRFTLDSLQGSLAVVDLLQGEGNHAVASRFHLAPDLKAQVRPATEDERARAACVPGAPQRIGAEAVELRRGEGLEAVLLLTEGLIVGVEQAPYSPGYGELTSAPVVVARGHLHAPAQAGAVFLFNSPSAVRSAS